MPFADLDGVRMHYRRDGAGPKLLVVNGSGSDLRHKPAVFDWPLASQFDILAYDHRGLGQSEPTDPDHQPSMADFANDALALASHVGWDDFAVMGISFGGMVAQEIALRGLNRVTRLALLCTSSGGAGNPSYPLHEVYAQEGSKVAQDMARLLDSRTETDPEFRAKFEKLMAGGDRPDRPQQTPPGLVKQLEARRLHDTWDRLPTLNIPTLIAAGKYDPIAPLVNSQNLHAQIPNSSLAVFEGGHIFMWQDRSAMPAVVDFLLGEQ